MLSTHSVYSNSTIQAEQKLTEIIDDDLIQELYRLYNCHAKSGLCSYQKTYIHCITSQRTTNGATALQLMLQNDSIHTTYLIGITKLFHSFDPLQLNIQDDFGYNALCYALKRNITKYEINTYGTTPEITKLLIELGSEVSVALYYQELRDNLKLILFHQDTLFLAFFNLFFNSKLFESEVLLAKLNVIESIIYSKEKQDYVYINSKKKHAFHTIHDALWLYFETSKKHEQKSLYQHLSHLLFIAKNQKITDQSDILNKFTKIELIVGINKISILHLISKLKYSDHNQYKILQYIAKKILKDTDIDINAPDAYGRTALHTAATHGNIEIAKLLVAKDNTNLIYLDDILQTPLHRSLLSNNVYVVKFFLDLGYDPDLRDSRGYSTLHRAVSKQNIKIIQLLLEYGATVETRNIWGGTPITNAISNCASDDVINLLREYSEDLSFHTITMQRRLCDGCCTIA